MKITGNSFFKFVTQPDGAIHDANIVVSPVTPPALLHGSYIYSGAVAQPVKFSNGLFGYSGYGQVARYYEFVAPPAPPSPTGRGKIRRIASRYTGEGFRSASASLAGNYTLTGTGSGDSPKLETPHGISYRDTDFTTRAGVSGHYNFYMAFHGPGYYQSRAGELLTFGENAYDLSARPFTIQRNDFSASEGLKFFGLRLVPEIKHPEFGYCKGHGSFQNVHEGTHDCPQEVKRAYKFEVLDVNLSAGTYLGGMGGNPYNHNPLPSSYDRGIFVANSLYTSAFLGPISVAPHFSVKAAEGCYYTPGTYPTPTFNIRTAVDVSGRALVDNQGFLGGRNSDGNASICSLGADGEDSYVDYAGADSPPHNNSNLTDPTSMPVNGIDSSVNSKSAYWHYVFKYNHYSLPFENTSEHGRMIKQNTIVNENHWWDYRECPENIDYLNHAFGNNITACPMNYLDVPYYASIGKFGYFGTRFQDTWKGIHNEDAQPEWNSVYDGEVSPDAVLYTSDQTTSFKAVLKWKDTSDKDIVTTQLFNMSDGQDVSMAFNTDYGIQDPDDPAAPLPHADGALLIDEDTEAPVVVLQDMKAYSIDKLELYYRYQKQHLDWPHSPTDPTKALDADKKYSQRGTGERTITNRSLTTNVARLTTSVAHGFVVGDTVSIAGVGAPFNGHQFVVTAVGPLGAPPTTFDYACINPNIASVASGGSATVISADEDYSNLLKLAATERLIHSFAISDQIVFLRANYNIIVTSPEYVSLAADNLQNGDLFDRYNFVSDFRSLLFDYLKYNDNGYFFEGPPRGLSDCLMESPLQNLLNKLSGDDKKSFESVIKKYGYLKVSRLVRDNEAGLMKANTLGGAIDVAWYDRLIGAKRSRMAERYFSNIGKGKPVDLFPEGSITFSFETSDSYANSNFIKYAPIPSASQLKDPDTTKVGYIDVPDTELRYFHTALTNSSESSLLSNNDMMPKKSIFGTNNSPPAEEEIGVAAESFYLGYLNPRGCEKEEPKSSANILTLINLPRAYLPSTSIWVHYAPETFPAPTVGGPTLGAVSPPRVFFDLDHSLDKNFSCYLPLFLQQPINTETKSYLPPTFRVYAVDYHSIPEDKIEENRNGGGNARPEIAYWLRKTKSIDRRGGNFYPLRYKWYRILNTKVKEYLVEKKESLLDPPWHATDNPTGTWYCLEGGNSPECTVVIPSLCRDLAGNLSVFPTSIDNFSALAGPNVEIANLYHYFCRVVGRLGWRDSEMAKITCDPTITMEFAYKNAAGGGGSFPVGSLGNVSFGGNGLVADGSVVYENVQERIWNPYNNCESWKFVGPEAVGGVTRVWTPGHLVDPRGKKVRRSHWTDFGTLGKITTNSEPQCYQLYAKRALPYCDTDLGLKYAGVSIRSTIIHRTAADIATLTYNSRIGLIVQKMKNIGDLFVPPSMQGYDQGSLYPGYSTAFFQPAHFQFENNLGLIKNYSRYGTPIAQVIGGTPANLINDLAAVVNANIFGKPGGNKVLTGVECGYVKPSFGRFMHFYVETFDTFYSICESGGIKPKKVKNLSHIAGGLRAENAGLQFNWLGKPRNARLKRVSMPGPYAFQWKVERHNRDRSGNGMSLGFWSYYWEKPIEDMYDAAAVTGALKRMKAPSYAAQARSHRVRSLRYSAWSYLYGGVASALSSAISFRNVRFGPDLGQKLGCGNIRLKEVESSRISITDPGDSTFNVEDTIKEEDYDAENAALLDMGLAPAQGFSFPFIELRPTPEVYNYAYSNSTSSSDLLEFGCDSLNSASCFFPCVSLKWPDGFSPKGKKMKTARITTCASCDESQSITVSSQSGPAKPIWRKKISACSDGNRDACNYITPTIHMGIDCWPAGVNVQGSAMIYTALNL